VAELHLKDPRRRRRRMARGNGKPRGRPPHKNSRPHQANRATNRARTPTRNRYGRTTDSAPGSCAPSGGARRVARPQPQRMVQTRRGRAIARSQYVTEWPILTSSLPSGIKDRVIELAVASLKLELRKSTRARWGSWRGRVPRRLIFAEMNKAFIQPAPQTDRE
jgi:hypothetical protein